MALIGLYVLLCAAGVFFLLAGVCVLRDFGLLWTRGHEARVTVIDVITRYRASLRFTDLHGQARLLRNCPPPRFGQFRDGSTRPITYLLLPKPVPWWRRPRIANHDDDGADSLLWMYWERRTQWTNVVFGVAMLGIAVMFLAGPTILHRNAVDARPKDPFERCRKDTGGLGDAFVRCMMKTPPQPPPR